MTEGQLLLLLLAALYLSDSVLWVRPGTVAFVCPWGRTWRVARRLLPGVRGAFVFLNPLPPYGKVFLAHLPRIAFSAGGVASYSPQAPAGIGRPPGLGLSFPYEEIRAVSPDGPVLKINGKPFARLATSQHAEEAASLIQKLKATPPSSRESLIKESADRAYDLDQASRRLALFQKQTRPLSWACPFLFILLFGFFPLASSIYGVNRVLIPGLIPTLVTAILISFFFQRFHKMISRDSTARYTQIAKMLVCPTAAVRALDLLSADLLARFHPLTVSILLGARERPLLVEAILRDLRYPLRPRPADSEVVAIADAFGNTELERGLVFLKKAGISTKLEPPGTPREPGSIHYCPRCGAQFNEQARECPDCPGIPLLGYS